jgi:rhamnosyltransferase
MLHLGIELGNTNSGTSLPKFGEPLVTNMSVSDAPQSASASRPSLLRKTAVVIPTYNAGRHWNQLHSALQQQGLSEEQILIVDSSSSDNTRKLARRAGYRLKQIPKESFRHGATRQMAAESLGWAEVLIYMTQDAAPSGENSIKKLVGSFDDPEVGAAYGRQLPRLEASPIERHARLFNYPDASDLRTFSSRNKLGIKAAFISNSFAAYRRSALLEVGGFPRNTIVSEEVTVAARMLIANWKVAYQADAAVIHSHPLTVKQEFSRYFDIGVHHGRAKWLLHAFGGAGEEGRTFVMSQMRYLAKTKPSDMPVAAFRNLSKWCSYQLGLHERFLPIAVKAALSGYPHFWEEEREHVGAANSKAKHYRLESNPQDMGDERSRERRFEGLI